jgi:hypothetical protein
MRQITNDATFPSEEKEKKINDEAHKHTIPLKTRKKIIKKDTPECKFEHDLSKGN